MNNEIVKVLTQKEYISTFLDYNLRIDRREFDQKRNLCYQFGILDSFCTSASCTLGEGNKIIAVLKSHNTIEILNENTALENSDYLST